jgi:hypothetical protein
VHTSLLHPAGAQATHEQETFSRKMKNGVALHQAGAAKQMMLLLVSFFLDDGLTLVANT